MTLGLIARPWTVRGGVHRGPGTDLAGFDEPGYAVITWSYVLSPEGKGTVVTTRTTVRCTDEPSRRRFLRYWRIVRPFSGVIRRESLRLLRRRVERQAATG